MITEKFFKESVNNEINFCCSGAVSNKKCVNIFFTWGLYLNEIDTLPDTILEISYRQWNRVPITYKFNVKRMRSDNWVKKFAKANISNLSNSRLKAIRKQGDYYVPTILYAIGDL
jgi:hypothetical protein